MFYLIFLLFSLGSVGRISFLGQEVNFYLYEAVYAAFMLFLVVRYRLKPFKEHRALLRDSYFFFGVLVFTFLISVPNFKADQNLVASLYLGRLGLYLLGIPYLFHRLKEHKNHKAATYGFLVYTAATAFFSVIQYAYYPDLKNLEYLGWDPHQYRMFGTVFDTSTAAALYGLVLLFLMFQGKRLFKVRALWIGSIMLYGLFGALTYSRGFYLAFTVTLLYYLLVRHKRIVSAFYLIAVLVGLLIIIPKPSGESANLGRVFTIQARAQDYQKGIEIWRNNPLLGIGYNHLRYVKPGEGGDAPDHAGASLSSSFLIVLVTSGILGLVGFLFMLYKLAGTSQIALYSIMFLSLFSLSDNILLHPFILFMETFLIAWGINKGRTKV